MCVGVMMKASLWSQRWALIWNVQACRTSLKPYVPLISDWCRLFVFWNISSFCSIFSCLILISGPSSSPILSLNSIAYRRVICVYQYQVADDLSGRSSSLKPCSVFFLTHAVLSGLCDLMHFRLKTPRWTLVCSVPSCCTNIHPVLKLKAPGCSQHCF